MLVERILSLPGRVANAISTIVAPRRAKMVRRSTWATGEPGLHEILSLPVERGAWVVSVDAHIQPSTAAHFYLNLGRVWISQHTYELNEQSVTMHIVASVGASPGVARFYCRFESGRVWIGGSCLVAIPVRGAEDATPARLREAFDKDITRIYDPPEREIGTISSPPADD